MTSVDLWMSEDSEGRYLQFVAAGVDGLFADPKVELEVRRVGCEVGAALALCCLELAVEGHERLVVAAEVHRTQQDAQGHPIGPTGHCDVRVFCTTQYGL